MGREVAYTVVFFRAGVDNRAGMVGEAREMRAVLLA